MRRLKKPTFWEPSGYWVDDEYIPSELRSELREIIPSDTPREQADAFMVRCSQQTQGTFALVRVTPPATQIAELRLVEQRAHALLLALHGMSEEAASGFGLAVDNLVFLTNPPFRISAATRMATGPATRREGRLLGSIWDLTTDLEAAAEYAATRVEASKQNKPTQQNARRLVFAIAAAHAGVFGGWPPIGDGWFHDFIERLGSHYKLACGGKLVNGVLRARKKPEPKL